MRAQNFSEDFKKSVVSKYLNRGNKTTKSVAADCGVALSCIYAWKNKYANVQGMNIKTPRRPSDRSTQEKIQLVISYFALSEEERGKFLREEGLHSSHLEQWKKLMELGFDSSQKSSELITEKKKIKILERELRRKESALAETAALLVLKKKADLLWGMDEDE